MECRPPDGQTGRRSSLDKEALEDAWSQEHLWAHKQSLTPVVHSHPRGRPTDTATRTDTGVKAGLAHTEHSRIPCMFGASDTSFPSEIKLREGYL